MPKPDAVSRDTLVLDYVHERENLNLSEQNNTIRIVMLYSSVNTR